MPAFLADAYLNRIDPYAVQFPQGFFVDGIRWYGLSYLAGFVIAYFLIRRVVKVGGSTLKIAEIGDMVVALAIGLVVGGRLGYALFYDRSLFYTFSDGAPWWDLLAINKGGMASHGGMIGGILASLYYARRHGHSWPHILDLLAFSGPPGLFFGRVANFVNGELYGRACAADFPLAVKFPQELGEIQQRTPEQLQPIFNQFISADLVRQHPDISLVQLLIDKIHQGHADVIAAVTPLLTPRYPSQLFEALLEGLVLFVILALLWRRPRKPLVVGGTFCLAYGILRIIGERFRQPDAQIGYQLFDLTRGQWLSIALSAAGVILLVIFARRNVPKMGGWRRTVKPPAA